MVFDVTATAAAGLVTVVPLVSVTAAVIVALPPPTPVTSPVVLTDATLLFDVLQTAAEVTFPVVPPE